MGRFDAFRGNLRRLYGSGRPAGRSKPVALEPEEHGSTDDILLTEHEIPIVAAPSVTSRDDEDIPRGLRIAAAWAWRLLLLGFTAAGLLWLIGRLHTVIIPVAIALLLSALLSPAVTLLSRFRANRSLSTALVMVGGIAAVAGTLTLVVNQFINGLPDLSRNAGEGVRQIQGWLRDGPLHLSNDQINGYLDEAQKWASTHRETLTSGALSTATTALDVLVGMFLVLFTTFFFLRDGKRIWRFVVRLLPGEARLPVLRAGEASWQTLVAYVRATVLVAFIDAVGIGIGLVAFKVPLAFPLAALVFLGAFIPIVGATLSGAVAVLVALVGQGPLVALAILGVVILVQQLEGHVLQPLIMGKAVSIHPLAVILGIASGAVLAGIVGALVSVPVIAVLNTGVRSLIEHRREAPPVAVVVSADPSP